MRYDPLVFDRKTVFMQRIADQVRRGYRWYTVGEVRLDRAPALVAKFARLYGVHLHRNQKLRERTSGLASADLLLWKPHTDTIVFCLLVTPGPHAARSLEQLRDSTDRKARLTLGDYELIQRPRPDSSRPAWTWRLTNDAYEGWRLRTLNVCRGGNDFDVKVFVEELFNTPGFAGIREQVKKLRALFRTEWKRRRAESYACPLIGRRHHYLQRLQNKGLKLYATVAAAKTGLGNREGGFAQ